MSGRTLGAIFLVVVPIVLVCWSISMHISKRVKIIDILSHPEDYDGAEVLIDGWYCGWKIPSNLPGPALSGPPVTRSDWIIADETAWIYVVARGQWTKGIKYGDKIIVYATVMTKHKNGTIIPYLYPLAISY